MRIVFAVLAVFLLSGAPLSPARADEAAGTAQLQTKGQRLDKLFAGLKRERNEQAAARIASQISDEWNQSGSASIDLMMGWSQKAIGDQKYDVALDFLDEVIMLQPDYAEAWNRRATVHFMMKNYAKSLSDIEETLKREPRHFGALSGMAEIMAETGHKKDALEAWQRVLGIYPMLRNAQNQVSTLSEELAGEAI